MPPRFNLNDVRVAMLHSDLADETKEMIVALVERINWLTTKIRELELNTSARNLRTESRLSEIEDQFEFFNFGDIEDVIDSKELRVKRDPFTKEFIASTRGKGEGKGWMK